MYQKCNVQGDTKKRSSSKIIQVYYDSFLVTLYNVWNEDIQKNCLKLLSKT